MILVSLTAIWDTIKLEDDMSFSFQSADSSQSKAVPSPPAGGGSLWLKLLSNSLLLLFLLFFVLKFKTQLGLPFEGEIELADCEQLFLNTCCLYI